MNKISFAIVGSGWRSEFYLRIVKALPDQFDICGMVARNEDKRKSIEMNWGIKCYGTIDELLYNSKPSFVVVSVFHSATYDIVRYLVDKRIPILSETPPSSEIAQLDELNGLVRKGAKIQVAEQYHLQPINAARLKTIESGKLGEISQAYISSCHGYHAISLMRKFLGIKYENAKISSYKFITLLIDGPHRYGILEERTVNSEQVIAIIDFGDKFGIYDFSNDQYASLIRAPRITVRGNKGEIVDDEVRYLKNFKTPAEIKLKRLNAGENGSVHEGYYLKGILFGDEWVYENNFIPARLMDDEIAVASCLEKMENYVDNGVQFYSLSEASQDYYLSLMVNEALNNKW
ncbi:MAG: Gfo/Idh/MocA family oxidoreductase [Candidatus Parvarchaeota archaeon]